MTSTLGDALRAAWTSQERVDAAYKPRTNLLQADTPDRVPTSIPLTQYDVWQIGSLKQYLRGHAQAGTLDAMPEGSLAATLNLASNKVKAAVAAGKMLAENFEQTGGRTRLFEPPLPTPRMDELDQAIATQSRTEELVGALHSRMGTREQTTALADSPPTMRDYVSNAIDRGAGNDNE